jgi:8-oxo-dGTP diphosphatase
MDASRKAYLESLPKKRMAAGCLFFDQQGQILLVKPAYKPGWEIPGGITELNESPKQCCQREVREELGLIRPIGELLVIDYNPPTGERTESLMFIFNGGILSAQDIESIHVREAEISTYRFFNAERLPPEMTITLRRRVLAAFERVSTSKDVYLENQEPV